MAFRITKPLMLHLAHVCLHRPLPTCPSLSGGILLPPPHTPYTLNTCRLPQNLLMKFKEEGKINVKSSLCSSVSPNIHCPHLLLQPNPWFLTRHMGVWAILRNELGQDQESQGVKTEVSFWQCLGKSIKMEQAGALCPLSSLPFSPSGCLVHTAGALATTLVQEV